MTIRLAPHVATEPVKLHLPDPDSSHDITAIVEEAIAAAEDAREAAEEAREASHAVPESSNPRMDGTASAGTAETYSRGDHRHPTDTTRAPLDSPHLTGTPTAPTPTAGDGSTKLATTAFVQGAVSDPTRESTGEVSGPLLGVSAKGWAEQEATTGKNLLPNNATSQTANGITLTVNADGSISISGTTSGPFSCTIYSGLSLDSGTYTLSTGTTLPTGSTLAVQTSDGNKAAVDQITFTASISGLCWIWINSGVTVNTTVYPMLRLASITDDTYEPYTGGAPSPSPNYAQEIRVARGRNLLDQAGITNPNLRRNADGSISAITAPSSAQSVNIGKANLLAGQTYTLSGGMSSTAYLYASVDGSNKTATASPVTFTAGADQTVYVNLVIPVDISPGATFYPQLELGSTPTPYVPYGCVGLEVGGNLLDGHFNPPDRAYQSMDEDGWVTQTLIDGRGATYENCTWRGIELEAGEYTLCIELRKGTTTLNNYVAVFGTDNNYGTRILRQVDIDNGARSFTFTLQQAATVGVMLKNYDNAYRVQIVKGTRFVPYIKHTTTPIPLPQRGWVAGLPDGTADALALDVAGHVVWELADEETTTAATDGVTGTIGVDVLSTTGQIADGATVLYKLATPMTEECGYVDMPEIPGDAVVSIPELAALGVKWSLSQVPMEVAEAYYKRAYSEYEGRIAALEDAMATLATS
jgi:hypothetical protein